MNENPEGTPNPLNPTPSAPTDAAPAEATPTPAPEEPVATPEEKAPEEKPAEEKAPEPAAEAAAVATTDAAVSSEKPAGKKTGLIVGLVILVLALIGGGVAAAMLLGGGAGGSGGDVSKAITKLLSGDVAKKVTTKGTITVGISNDDLPIDTIGAELNVGYDAENQASSGTINTTVALTGGQKISVGLEEAFVNKNLYLKVANNSDAPATNCANGTEDNCAPDPSDETAQINAVINMLADKWIRLPVEEMVKDNSLLPTDETTSCLLENITKDEDIDIAGLYKQNEFVKYTTEGVKIAKQNSPVYKLTFDAEKLAGFANAFGKSVENSSAVAKCFSNGGVTADEVTADDLKDTLDQVPPIYVEVNGDNNFTRLYMTYTAEDSSLEIKADLNFDYTKSVDAAAPAEYTDINDLLSGLMGGGTVYDDDDWDDWDDWDDLD